MLTRAFVIFSLTFASFAGAQTAPQPVQTDLDGDGLAETALLLYPGPGITHLLIAPVERPTVLAQDFVWRGGLGQEPSLAVSGTGNLLVSSGNQAVGRNRWLLIQTIVFRDQAYRVGGITYNWFDTADLNKGGTCDINLLTGQGVRRLVGQDPVAYQVDLTAPRIQEWNVAPLLETRDGVPLLCGVSLS